MNEPMNPPRTYDELLAALKAHPMKGVQWFAKFHPELLELYFNHGEAMVEALRAAEKRIAYEDDFAPSTDLVQLRAVLAALDGKDAT